MPLTAHMRLQEMLRTQWTICDGADLYDESLELPSLVKLRHTMRKRCRDYSLDVPQESVRALIFRGGSVHMPGGGTHGMSHSVTQCARVPFVRGVRTTDALMRACACTCVRVGAACWARRCCALAQGPR